MGTITRRIICGLLVFLSYPCVLGALKSQPEPGSCFSDTDCLKGKAICVRGECQCLKFLSVGDGKHKCDSGGVIACSPFFPHCIFFSHGNPKYKHSKCVRHPSQGKFCKCEPGYFGRAGVRGCLPSRGGQCFSDSNCRYYSICRNMKCQCKDQYIGDGTTCKPNCFEHSDCPSKYARCVNGKCVCRKGTEEDGKTCKPECRYFFHCLQIAECKSGMCKCREELLGDGETCHPAPRHKCSSDKDCHSKAKCESGDCFCQGKSVGNGRFCRSGHTCPSNHTCGANTICLRDFYFAYHYECRCLPGYVKDQEGNCVDCLSNKDCPAYSACSKGKCKCRDELVGDGKTCKPAPLHKCSDGTDCFSKATCYYGRCMCEGNTAGNGLYCRNSLPCPQNNACGEHSICVVDPLFPNITDCKCVMGYEKSRQGNCVELNKCVKRGLYCPERSTCISQKPESYTCICDEGFRKVVRGEDSVCEDVDECSAGKAGCSGDRCVNSIGSFHCVPCPQGFFDGKDGKCVDRILSNNRKCNCGRHEECLKGKCKCKKGYKKSKQGNCVHAHDTGANPKGNANSDHSLFTFSSVTILMVGFIGCLAFGT